MIKNKFPGFEAAQRPSMGLSMIFDISGFTNFFNKPDIHHYMTEYINHIIECVEITIWGGDNYWMETERDYETLNELPLKPFMRKFLGDGMLYVWEDNEERLLSDKDFKVQLINRLYNLQLHFAEVNRRLQEDIPIGDLPEKIKFGLAQGSIFKLLDSNGNEDCIGPCVNLASRLVKYCPEINFIASARLNLPKKSLKDNGYCKIIARELRSFENEIIIIDEGDYNNVSIDDKERLFKEL